MCLRYSLPATDHFLSCRWMRPFMHSLGVCVLVDAKPCVRGGYLEISSDSLQCCALLLVIAHSMA
jgi:hypothetical protein